MLEDMPGLRYDSKIQIVSNLCITLDVVRSLTLKKWCDVMLSKFQLHIEKDL